MSEPVVDPAAGLRVVSHDRVIPDRWEFAIAPLESWREPADADGMLLLATLRSSLSEWLLLNHITRPAGHREVIVGPTSVQFWRGGFDPMPGDQRAARVGYQPGPVVQVRDLGYEVRIVNQPPDGLLKYLARQQLLSCVSTGAAFDPATLAGQELRCRVLVDEDGRHPGDHRDDRVRPALAWKNLYPAVDGLLDVEVTHGRVVEALALLDEKLFGLPHLNVGGLPTVERELLFGALNDVARELLGDTWASDLRAACEALKAKRRG